MTISDTPTTTTSMTTTEGALRLWTEIVRGLQAAGYSKVVPEYLKLSRVLSQVRMTELLRGQPEAEHWSEIRKLAAEALESLNPLVEAAKILAELPSELQGIHAVAPVAASAEQQEGTATLLMNEPIITDLPAKTIRKSQTARATRAVRKSPASKPGVPAKKKTRKSTVSRAKARAKRRAQ